MSRVCRAGLSKGFVLHSAHDNTWNSMSLRLALYQPDIPQNAGTMLRLAACLGLGVDVIGPAGFDLTDRALRRAGLDYLDHVEIARHVDFAAFAAASATARRRIVLLSTRAAVAHVDFVHDAHDVLLVGRESAGVPDAVHAAAGAAIRIPMRAGRRSLNVAVAAAIVVAEALRQTGGFAEPAARGT